MAIIIHEIVTVQLISGNFDPVTKQLTRNILFLVYLPETICLKMQCFCLIIRSVFYFCNS